jgi:N-acyl-D-amino-acid deacylase
MGARAAFLAITALAAGPGAGPDLDIALRNGRIVDGSGNPSYIGDVGIAGGKIVAVGHLTGRSAARTIDVSGLVVAPGFVDIHNHSDSSLLVDGDGQSMVHQGVTTVILGEGESAAPSANFAELKHYFARLLEKGTALNVGTYLGSSSVWIQVHGARPGPPGAADLDRMRAIVRTAMAQGALGVASSLSGPPGAWIDTDSLVAMCEAAAPFGGIYSTHMRTEGFGVFEAVEEALSIGRRAKVPVDIIHLKIAEHKLWGKMPQLAAALAAARARGVEVQANVYPYRAGQNDLVALIPPWAQEGGRDAMLARLRDPAARKRIAREMLSFERRSDGWYNHYTATGSWEGMLLARLRSPAHKKFEGKRMNEVIAALGAKARPADAVFELLLENGGSVSTVYFHHSEEDMRVALRQPFVSIGSDGGALRTDGPLSAGHPHPRFYGTFPRVLGRYVREEKILSLEEAVRKMTSANTAKVHVFDRGLVRPGQWADVTVFDPAKIADRATFEKPHQYSVGVEYLLVNGKVVLERGKHTGARPGAIVYGPGKK